MSGGHAISGAVKALSARWSQATPHLFRQVSRFGAVGVVAAAAHALLFAALVESGIPGLLANSMAFCCAFFVSYAGHSRWTFARAEGRRVELGRFGLTTMFGFLLNSVLAFVFVDLVGGSPWVAGLLMVTVTPAMIFILLRLWVFA